MERADRGVCGEGGEQAGPETTGGMDRGDGAGDGGRGGETNGANAEERGNATGVDAVEQKLVPEDRDLREGLKVTRRYGVADEKKNIAWEVLQVYRA